MDRRTQRILSWTTTTRQSKPSKYTSARLVPMLHYYQNRVPREYFKWKATIFLRLVSTASIAVLSHFAANSHDEYHDLRSIARVVSRVSAGIAAWQEFFGTEVNRHIGAVLAIKDLMDWWNGLTAVDRTSLVNTNKLVLTGEDNKMSEVNAWADASRRVEGLQEDDAPRSSEGVTENHVFDSGSKV